MRSLLLVDDDELTCEANQRLLTRMGYVVVCANTGSDALAVLHNLRFDLVILDWMMPEMDGLEVLRRLRKDPHTCDVKVVLYSAADDPKTAREALRLGATDCMLKSGGFFALYDRIEQLLPHAVPRQRAGADLHSEIGESN
ncbi:MAG: response regulator [Tepidisphaeraceae bacterium]